ncbi:MAG: benzylsuccinate synthase gamma subunit family protein [Desulfobacterales bacterium]|jgi:benzylsuccinate synthase/naphthyl-2-methylsuccinate synthase gamma subunit|nr:benzylsuccinate synthase gamma subunit family protein [Desulfobacterales bacterium]
MGKCLECAFFFSVPKDAEDYEPGKGDCVTEHKDEKGKFWQSKPVFEGDEVCRNFSKN